MDPLMIEEILREAIEAESDPRTAIRAQCRADALRKFAAAQQAEAEYLQSLEQVA